MIFTLPWPRSPPGWVLFACEDRPQVRDGDGSWSRGHAAPPASGGLYNRYPSLLAISGVMPCGFEGWDRSWIC